MTISKSWFTHLTRAFALSLCTALLLSFVSCSDSTTSQEPKAVTSTYTVKHLLQNLQDDEYTEDEEATEQKAGTYGTQTDAVAKTYEGFTAKTFAQETIQADGSTVIQIYYDRNTYTVSYSSTYGEPPESKPVKYGYVLTAADLPDLTQTNYSFKGWLLDGTSITAGYTVKKDITLTAQWDEIIATYTVKHLLQNLHDDEYTEDEEATEQKSGTPGTQTAAAAKPHEGFTAKSFAQETIQADGSTVIQIYYDRKTYTLSYSSEYGDAPASKPVKFGYELTAADLPILPDTVLSFNGWRLDGASIEAGYTVKTNIKLTAKWEGAPPTYTVKHLLQNFSDEDYTEDSTELKSGTPGAQTAAAAKSYEGFTAKTFAQETIQDDDSTVVEIYYDRNTYTISYSSEYGDAPASKTVKYGYELTAADLPDLTQTNYSFNGWCLPSNSNRLGYTVKPGGYTVKKDITLTAQWEEIFIVTKENFSEVMASIIGGGVKKIIVTGELSDSDLEAIAHAIYISGFYVNLDLSQTTGLTSIPDSTFGEHEKLSGITIPDSVTSIGRKAFFGCSFLSSVTIPDSVTSIGREAFRNLTELTSLTFTDTTTWYSTDSSTNWENKTNGTLTDVSNPSKNAALFTIHLSIYYWYKLDE